MNRREFERLIRTAPDEHSRVAWFGALLGRETNLEHSLVVVGGSAIEVYLTSSRYVSADIDIVGNRSVIGPVLRKWGFREVEGRDRRIYWQKHGIGLVDLVGAHLRAGLPSRRHPTPFGDVLLAPVETLILRRLVRAAATRSDNLLAQAEALALAYGRSIDWEYLRAEATIERVRPLLEALNRRVRPPKPTRARLGRGPGRDQRPRR